MKLTFMGAGSAFTYDNFQSNMLLELPEGDGVKRFMIDCGSDARHSLSTIGYGPGDINGVYVSHLHADHIGGLEWLALVTFFTPGVERPALFCNDELVEPLWSCLRGGLQTMKERVATLDTFFNVRPVREGGVFEFAGTEFSLQRVEHFYNGPRLNPSFGIRWKTPLGKEVFITTDATMQMDFLSDVYNEADIIFNDCETAPFKSGVHAHYTELVTLPDEIREKMWLYHYQDGELPDAEADGFKGFVMKGQCFDFTTAPATVTQPRSTSR